MHYYQFNIGDYASHTRHLTAIEDLAYRRLLDAYYLQERPLNTGIPAVARQINLRDHEADVQAVLEEFFELTEAGWVNRRADQEIAKYQEFIAAGKRGAAKAGGKAAGKAAGKAGARPESDDDLDEAGDTGDQVEAFEDGDAEAEAIPEVPIAPVKTSKRGSRAKEKQLLKELGGRSGITEEQREATRNNLKTLIKLGKERAYLTYAEINDHLPEDLVEAEAIESIVSTFNDMGIAVYDQAPDAETLLITDTVPVASSDDDAEEEAEAALSTVDSEFGRTTDPVRMYMREMGSVELLDRKSTRLNSSH